MAAQVKPDIPVLFLDTGMLFGQTLDYRKSLAAQLGLTDVRDLRPAHADLAVHDPDATLHQTDVDACCRIRKVLPLDRALEGFDALDHRPQALPRRRPAAADGGRGRPTAR